MKAFGKKTLTLALVTVMVLALGITAFAGEAQTVKVGKTVTLSLTAGTWTDLDGREIVWTSSNNNVAAVTDGVVTGVKAGSATITAKAEATTDPERPEITETWPVTVEAPKITEVSAFSPSGKSVGYGLSEAEAKKLLPKQADVKYDNDTTGKVDITNWTCSPDYSNTAAVGTEFAFTPVIPGTTGLTLPKFTLTVVKYDASDKADLGTVTVAAGTSERNVRKALPASIDPGNGDKLVIGSGSNADFSDWVLQGTFNNKAGNYVEFKATAKNSVTANYIGLGELSIEVKFVNTTYNVSDDFGTKSGTLSSVINAISNEMEKTFGVPLKNIEFNTLGDDGGTLYTDDELADEVREDVYTAKEAKAMVFVPDGTGADEVITYEAVGAEYAYMTGKITLKSDNFVVIEASISNTEVLPFSANELQEALEEVLRGSRNRLNPTLVSITGIRCSSGGVYVDYDDSIALNKNKKASSSADYYVEPTGKQDGIDDLTYVPASKYSGVVDITFEAEYTYKTSTTTNKLTKGTMQMVLRVSVNDEGDIVVNVPNGGYVSIPADEFEQLLLKEKGKSSVLRWVEFDGLPNSNQKGYMYENYSPGYYNQAIKRPDSQKYYYADSKYGDIALADLVYVTGTKTNVTHRVEFTIHYATSSSSTASRTMTGTMDIVVGATGTGKVQILNGTMRDSDTFKFSNSDYFKKDVASVTFTAQPVGGKLYENYLTSSQKEVTLNVPYTTGTGTRTLSSVTFVPIYGTVGTCSIPCKVITTANKTINYQVNLTLTRSTASQYFTDVTANSYGSYADSIDFLYKFGIVNGMSTNSLVYSPNTNVTRGQWIAMLYRAAGNPAVTGTNSFTDVPAWCKDAVQWAVTNGITNGTSATTFSPNLELNRQTIVTFMYRWVVVMRKQDGTGIANLNAYTDGASVSDWAQVAMKWALKNNYIDAQGTRLDPVNTANRAEVADFLHRLLTK